MKNKFIKSLIAIGIITQLGFCSTVSAQENPSISNSNVTLKSREIFIDSLPKEQQELVENESGEIVAEDYDFFEYKINDSGKEKIKELKEKTKNNEKIQEKDLLNASDYTVINSSLEKFEESRKNEVRSQLGLNNNLLKSSRPYEVAPGVWINEDLNNAVVMHGIKVIRNSSNNRIFTAKSSFTWSRTPNFNTTDAVGITCSPNMVILSGTMKAYAQAFIPVANNPTLVVDILKEGPLVDPNGLGVAASVSVKGAAEYNTGYVQSDVQFSDTSSDIGLITSEYLSKTISISDSLSFDLKGRPSIGFESTSNRYSKAVNIYKYNN